MKKIFTLLLIALMATCAMAQSYSPMKFVGASKASVLTMLVENEKDTVIFQMTSGTTGDITFPQMKGMSTIPSFTVKDVTFSMGENHVITFPEQTFSSSVMVDGAEKKFTGISLTGSYTMTDKCMALKIVFKYGAMPFETTYEIKGYYVKEDATGVASLVKSSESEAYDMSGRVVNRNAKGLVVKNGKKYVR